MGWELGTGLGQGRSGAGPGGGARLARRGQAPWAVAHTRLRAPVTGSNPGEAQPTAGVPLDPCTVSWPWLGPASPPTRAPACAGASAAPSALPWQPRDGPLPRAPGTRAPSGAGLRRLAPQHMPLHPSLCSTGLLWCYLLHVLSWDFVPSFPKSLRASGTRMEGQQQLVLSHCRWSPWLGAELVPSPAPGQLLGDCCPPLGTLPGPAPRALGCTHWVPHSCVHCIPPLRSEWIAAGTWFLLRIMLVSSACCLQSKKCSKLSPVACSPPCSPSLGSEQAGTCLPALSCPAELACTLTLPFPLLLWSVGDFQRSKVGVHWNCRPNVQIT